MAGATTVSNLTNQLPKFMAEVRYTQQHMGIMEKLVERIPLPPNSGQTLNIPKIGTTTAHSLVEGVDMQQMQQLSDSNVAITPAEVGVQIFLTKRALRYTVDGLMRRAGKVLGNAMAKKLDQDLLGLFSGIDAGVGAAGAALQTGQLQAARILSRANVTGSAGAFTAGEPTPEPMYYVLHDFQWYDVAQDLLGVSSGVVTGGTTVRGAPDQAKWGVLSDHYMANIFSAKVFVDDNIAIDASDDAYGACFSKEALLLVPVVDQELTPDEDPSARGVELNLVSEYGYGEYNGQWGRFILSDVTPPTA